MDPFFSNVVVRFECGHGIKWSMSIRNNQFGRHYAKIQFWLDALLYNRGFENDLEWKLFGYVSKAICV
jgi:hypothetical protein